jgi:hypothetical protein
MPWVTFTTDHVKARLYDSEEEAYADVAGDAVDRLAEIVIQTCAKFRGAIRSNPQVTEMGAEGTLPDFCIFDAAVIARTALIGLSPVTEGVTDPRRDEYNAAKKTLESLPTMNPKAFGADPSESSESSTSPASYGGAALLEF